MVTEEYRSAYNHFEIWATLDAYRDDHLNELNMATAFWGLTMQAHTRIALIHMYHLVEENNQVVSIPVLWEWIEKNLALFSVEPFAARLKKKYPQISLDEQNECTEGQKQRQITLAKKNEHRKAPEESAQTIDHLKVWRDKVLAHVDKDFLKHRKELDEKYPLSIDQVRNLLKTLGEILNVYSLAYYSSSYAWDIPYKSGFDLTMKALKTYSEARNKLLREP